MSEQEDRSKRFTYADDYPLEIVHSPKVGDATKSKSGSEKPAKPEEVKRLVDRIKP